MCPPRSKIINCHSLRIQNLGTHDRNCLPPAQAHSKNRAGRLPSPQVDGIRSPIRHPSPQRPCLILNLDRIHILIRPNMRRSKGGFLLWQFPCLNRSAALLELLLGRDIIHLREFLHLARFDLQYLQLEWCGVRSWERARRWGKKRNISVLDKR